MVSDTTHFPIYITGLFVVCIIYTYYTFYKSAGCSKPFLWLAFFWMVVQGVLAKTGFYLDFDARPPRFLLAVSPPILAIALLFITTKGRRFINKLSVKSITLLHIVRVPVEVCLWWLYITKMVPELMTFEGRNFDILAGLSASIIYYLVFIKKAKFSRTLFLSWNIASLILLLNIVTNAILSAPTPLQQFAFDQPNVAVFYFPFILLPSFIVPLVLFSHLTALFRWKDISAS
jgi:hypothetical protein